MMQHLKVALENKVKVIVITRPLGDFKDKNISALQDALDVLKVAGVSSVLWIFNFIKYVSHCKRNGC